MTFRVFIPPAQNFGEVVKDPATGRTHVVVDKDWYLFLSRRINSTSLLLDNADFGTIGNVLASRAFSSHVPMPTPTQWEVDQNVISGAAFRAHVPMPTPTNWAEGPNLLANQIFGG